MARVEVDVRVLVQQIIDAVGNQFPLAGGAKIVVKGFHRLGGEGRASTVKIPQQFRDCSGDSEIAIARASDSFYTTGPDLFLRGATHVRTG